jgi:RNA repair pathway DNA polymerase beta family
MGCVGCFRHIRNMTIAPCLHSIVAAQPYPLLFANINGAHLHGFPTPDSDFDLRGACGRRSKKLSGWTRARRRLEQSRISSRMIRLVTLSSWPDRLAEQSASGSRSGEWMNKATI